MAFTGSEGTIIEVTAASALTASYQENNPDSVKGYFFGKTQLLKLLNQAGSVGIRIYFGQNTASVNKLVLVGVTANENDITTLVLDEGCGTPPYTGVANQLNNL